MPKMDQTKLKDYITTLALAAIPVIVTYQGEIGQHVPVEYALLFTIGIGVLSQLTANTRVKEAYKDTSYAINKTQSKVQEYQDLLTRLQTEIDERQALVDQMVEVTTEETSVEHPLEGQ